jgi:hypothetical protein
VVFGAGHKSVSHMSSTRYDFRKRVVPPDSVLGMKQGADITLLIIPSAHMSKRLAQRLTFDARRCWIDLTMSWSRHTNRIRGRAVELVHAIRGVDS